MANNEAIRSTGQGMGVLRRLAADRRGNTLAMLAAFLIPMSALTGSAVDMGRLYLVKVRLQQACDAGALAGRKFMADSTATTLDTTAVTQARAFFANNFPSGIMGTPAYTTANVPFTPTKTTDNQVAGTATTQVPMTVMKMFGQSTRTITVTCEARYDIADTDVMFVLDTTGSMACAAADVNGCGQPVGSYPRPDGTGTAYYVTEKSNSKIGGVRTAVLNFYDTVAANIQPTTHVRYGFVTYTSTVNAGFAVRSLSSGNLVNNWSYQTRIPAGDANNGKYTDTTTNNVTKADCDAKAGRSPASGFRTDGSAALTTEISWTVNNNSSGPNALGSCVTRGQPLKPIWRYNQAQYDVSRFVAGDAIVDPTKVTGVTSRWQGCLEERDTRADASFDISNLPPDLDPDLPATSDATRWRPMWPDVIYYRGSYSNGIDYSGNSSNPYGDYVNNSQTGVLTNLLLYNNIAYGYVSCGKPVQRLATLTRDDVSNYVNAVDFKAQGGTYHDTGMIWGTRLISPTGIFAQDTKTWPGRQSPNRYIVFMTDGEMSPNQNIYGMYGLETYDQRVTGGDYSDYTGRHNARFLAECAAAKARNITVFVVGFGQTLNDQLTQCASPGQAFYASDNAALDAAFRKIAAQVAMLRVSK